MDKQQLFYIALIGAILFFTSAFLGGLLIDNYSVSSQFISESYASDTRYGLYFRIFGYIPSGILFTIFCLGAVKHFPPSRMTSVGFIGLAIFYGFGTVVTGVFPCDSGCDTSFTNVSTAQRIHTLAGMFMYLFTPLSLIFIGFGLRKFTSYKNLSKLTFACGILSILCIYRMSIDINSNYKGLFQRMVEVIVLFWFIRCAFRVRTLTK